LYQPAGVEIASLAECDELLGLASDLLGFGLGGDNLLVAEQFANEILL
jgi:hypothetical protein